jgi:elongator complex protein 2
MAVKIFTTYIAASANRFHHVAHCSPSSLVAFGSSKVIAVWDTLVC